MTALRARFAVSALSTALLFGAVPAATPSAASVVKPRQYEWSTVSPAPLQPRFSPRVVAIGGRFLVLGGIADGRCPGQMDCGYGPIPPPDTAFYDPASDLWVPGAPLPLGFRVAAAVAVGQSVYAFAGNHQVRTLLVLDPMRASWRPLPLPPVGRPGLLAFGDRLVVRDLDNSARSPGAVFDPVSLQWDLLPARPFAQPGEYDALVAVDDRLVLVSLGNTRSGRLRAATWASGDRAWSVTPGRPAVNQDGDYGPVGVGARVIWSRATVYDAVAGRAERLPVRLRTDRACARDYADDYANSILPGVLVADEKVVLCRALYDPATGAVHELTDPPGPIVNEPGWAAGNGYAFRFGGAVPQPTTPGSMEPPTALGLVLRLPG